MKGSVGGLIRCCRPFDLGENLVQREVAVEGGQFDTAIEACEFGVEPVAIRLFNVTLDDWLSLRDQQVFAEGRDFLVKLKLFAAIIGSG